MSNKIEAAPAVERPRMDVDIVCVGFGPAMGGFLTTLSRGMVNPDGTPAVKSAVAPDMPPQVICYERADDLGFAVSGVVTKARGIRATFPDLDPTQIPMATPIQDEKVVYLLDPVGASRRSPLLKTADGMIRTLRFLLPVEHDAMELPYAPEFLHKTGGLVLSLGQFMQWVGGQVMGSGVVQVWPGTPVAHPLVDGKTVKGVRLADQGVAPKGNPEGGFMPGMDVHAALTVVGDGPVGPVGRQIDEQVGVPKDHSKHEWAVGMKFVVELPENTPLKPGMVLHTLGFPEPEIFGFLYVHPDRMASVGIFVPSWFPNPARTSYRYLQHFIQHPYLWRYLKGSTLKSWGAKSLQEAGRRGEPFLCGHGYARIGEGSGSTNVLTNSGVDEAWTTGCLLAEGVLELLKAGKPFTAQNLEATYVARRRRSWLEEESRVAEKARDGFQGGFVTGVVGMALSGLTGGKVNLPLEAKPAHEHIVKGEDYYLGRLPLAELERIRKECTAKGTAIHDAVMDKLGWPAIPFDGQLLVTQQDALLMGGKVQANAGYADHVVFKEPALCERCGIQTCVEICSGEAIRPGKDGKVPSFDREKCVHCGACVWNCSQGDNVEFRAGSGGFHSAVN